MRGSPHITYKPQKGSNKNDDAYTASDSKCYRKLDITCMDCPLPQCLMDREMPKIRNVITNTY
ncbi:MAG: hypothetical protein WC560_10100 [Syntrophales bacterium]